MDHSLIVTPHKIALADADPLGVNTNVTFDEVGGLDDRKYRIHVCFLGYWTDLMTKISTR